MLNRFSLEIMPAQIVSGSRTLNVQSMQLISGGVYTVHGKADTLVRELLYLIAGLELSLKQSLRSVGNGLGAPDPDIVGSFGETIRLDGQRIYMMPPSDRARQIGFIFENPEWGFLCNTVSEDFLFSFYAANERAPPIYRLKQYGLFEARFQTPDTLSGGEQQRLACAAVMERSPRLVIADFSSSNLDVQFRNKLLLPWIHDSVTTRDTTFVLRGLSETDLPPCNGAILVDRFEAKLGLVDRVEFPLEADRLKAVGAAFAPRVTDSSSIVLLADGVQTQRSKAPLSIVVSKGDVRVVTGPNGSGKTSFGLAVLGKLPWTGRMELSDCAYPAMSFQNPEHCLFARSVADEIVNPSLIQLCELEERALSMPPNLLSRSKQKLLSIVAACEISGDLVILDEPTAGLDFSDQIVFQRILAHYSTKSFLLFTHDAALTSLAGVKAVDISEMGDV